MPILKEYFNWDKEPVFLIDGSSFIYRAFYAYPDLKTSRGFPTNALFILLRLLLKILTEQQPYYGCFIIDGKGSTFRHKIYPSYKANRQKMPESLIRQIPPICKGVSLLGVRPFIAEEVEADDIIASLCNLFKKDHPVVIVGIDKDLLQLLDTNIVLWDPSSKKERIITLEDFLKKEEFPPSSWPLYQALVGDKTDNIPGVPGIGPKTAKRIIKLFPTLKELINGVTKLTPREQLKLKEHLNDLERYLSLTLLDTEAITNITIEDIKIKSPDMEKLIPFLKEYEFNSLIKELSTHTEPAISPPIKEKENLLTPLTPSIPPFNTLGIMVEKDKIILGGGEKDYILHDIGEIIPLLNSAKNIFINSLKALLYSLKKERKEIPLNKIFDCGLGAYLFNPEIKDYSIVSLYEHLHPLIEEASTFSGRVIAVGRYLNQVLKENNLFDLFMDIEIPLVPILLEMEIAGIKIDINRFHYLLSEVESEIQEIETKIYALAGEKFNIRSSKQLANILFKKLGLRSYKKTPKGDPSTSSEVLEMLKNKHPIIPLILNYKKLEKLRSTYLSPLPRMADRDGRIHTVFNQMGTATGRISSSNPNLQNIPIRGELGGKIRSMFVAEEGKQLLSADYSQIELRVLAHFSKDPYLLEAFSRGEDIHIHTAALLFDKVPQKVSEEERRKAKTINFGLLYGMGPQKLSREMGVSISQAKKFIDLYFQKLVGVKDFFQRIEEEAKQRGFVSTLSGRRRYLPDINSANEHLASQAKRIAINTTIQGSAADIIKMAMIKIYHSSSVKSSGTKLLLQIHDELLFEVPCAYAREIGELIARDMEKVVELDVPLVVDWGYGNNWAEAH